MYALGELLRFSGDAKGHKAAMEAIVAKNPGNADAQAALGDISYDGKNYRKAEEFYAAALAANPAHFEALVGKARTQYRREDMKGALESLIRCLATDHAGKVRVVGICPGTIDTPMLAATCEGWDKPVEELYAEVAKKIPVRRLGQPIDIAKTAAFLLSDDSEYINATSIVLDGGTMALPPW